MAARMNAKPPPAGVTYEVAHTSAGQLIPDDEPDFGGWFVRRVVDRSRGD